MTESYRFGSGIWSSFVPCETMFLIRQKNQKHLSSAKLVKSLLLLN